MQNEDLEKDHTKRFAIAKPMTLFSMMKLPDGVPNVDHELWDELNVMILNKQQG